MPLSEHFRNDMRSIMPSFMNLACTKKEDMNLSLISFLEFCTPEEQELRRFDYMKDVVLDEGIPIKLNS
jgi:hypothetical protein